MKTILLLFLFAVNFTYAQEDAWVYFNDKPDIEFYMANPLEMLTQKALNRRVNQNIPLDALDVPVHSEYISAIGAANGITVMAKSKWLNALHVRGSEEDVRALTSFSFVNRIDFADDSLDMQERNVPLSRVAKAEREAQINETQVNYNYGTSGNQVEMLNGHLLHQQNYTGIGITIAVMDNGYPGVDTAQPFARLNQNNLIAGGYNFVSRSNNIYTGGTHGTMVLSTMGGYTQGQLVGTAPDASYYLFITEDVADENPVEESYWVEAAEMADSLGVDVINTSLGYFAYANPAYSYTYNAINGQTSFITRGANVAFTRGMMLVTSAGNSGATGNPNIAVPADAFNTLTVGAVDADRVYANFSSIGPSADGRVKPDVMARGLAATLSNTDGSITTASGTSFSGPITAGLVACLWQALPNATNIQLLQIIKQSADRYANPNEQYGYGIPDFDLALQNNLLVADTVRSALRVYPNPVSELLTFKLPQNVRTAKLLIYNGLGQRVVHQEIRNEAVLSVSNLSSGIYNYYVEAGTAVYTGRFIKE